MSLFGRALAGVGGAAAGIASRYIDEELANNRAKMLAELQRGNAKAMRQDAIDVETDPANVGKQSAAARSLTLSGAEAKRAADLETLNDTGYQGALSAKADKDAKDTTRRSVESRKTELAEVTPLEIKALQDKLKGTMGLEAQRSGLMAEAAARAQAKFREPKADPGDELAKRMNAIQKQLGRELTEPEKLGLLGLAKGRDPEMDTETVKETVMNPDGTMREVTRRQVRRPGAAGSTDDGDPIMKALMEQRLAAAAAKPKAAAPVTSTQAQPQNANPMASMSDRDLKRVAGIQGHARQREAQAEIQRRESTRPEIDPNSYGFR